MVISELARTKIKELLQEHNAKFLKISLAGNTESGFQTIITFEQIISKDFITITTSPLVFIEPHQYIKFANSILDFNTTANELIFKF